LGFWEHVGHFSLRDSTQIWRAYEDCQDFKRSFKFGRREVMADINLFNALNSGVVLSENQTYGTALGTPSSILKNRMLRLAVQAKW
jgi:hypothetical protein